MDVFIQRNYGNTSTGNSKDPQQYPEWDYRSRRYAPAAPLTAANTGKPGKNVCDEKARDKTYQEVMRIAQGTSAVYAETCTSSSEDDVSKCTVMSAASSQDRDSVSAAQRSRTRSQPDVRFSRNHNKQQRSNNHVRRSSCEPGLESRSRRGIHVSSVVPQHRSTRGLNVRDEKTDNSVLRVVFTADSVENYFIRDTYQPLVEEVGIDDDVCEYVNTDNFDCDDDTQSLFPDGLSNKTRSSGVHMPSLAVVLFLRENVLSQNCALHKVRTKLLCQPWRKHHRDHVAPGKIQASPDNKLDYYTVTDDLPLCAVRQVHYGKESIRMLRFTSAQNWEDMIQFYTLVSQCEPDLRKRDFCLFTLASMKGTVLQFALKKLPRGVVPQATRTASLLFRVKEIGNLVPLLPSMCSPISRTRWQTVDFDNNKVFFETMQKAYCRPRRKPPPPLSSSHRHSTPDMFRKSLAQKQRKYSTDSTASCLESTLLALLGSTPEMASANSEVDKHSSASSLSDRRHSCVPSVTSESDAGFKTLSDSDSLADVHSDDVTGWPPVYVHHKRSHTSSVDSGAHMGGQTMVQDSKDTDDTNHCDKSGKTDNDLLNRLRPSSQVGFFV